MITAHLCLLQGCLNPKGQAQPQMHTVVTQTMPKGLKEFKQEIPYFGNFTRKRTKPFKRSSDRKPTLLNVTQSLRRLIVLRGLQARHFDLRQVRSKGQNRPLKLSGKTECRRQ